MAVLGSRLEFSAWLWQWVRLGTAGSGWLGREQVKQEPQGQSGC